MEDQRSADPPTPGKCTRTKSVCLEKESYYYTVINHEKLYLNTFKKNKHTYIVLVFRKKYTGSKQKWDKTGSK